MEQLNKEGLEPHFLHLDVAAIESIEAAKKEVEEKYGRLDVLVHCAGLIMNVPLIYYSFILLLKFTDCREMKAIR